MINQSKGNMKSSSNLAYFLGIMLGDGSISKVYNKKRGYHTYSFQITSKDRILVESFRDVINKIMSLNYKYICCSGDGYFRTHVNSTKLGKWYNSLNLNQIEIIAEEYPCEFIRGIYESEGWLYKDKELGIGSTNKELIIFIQMLITKLGFKINYSETLNNSYNNKKVKLYRVRIQRPKEIIKFIIMINPLIKRGKNYVK